jgi:hypothetical protein
MKNRASTLSKSLASPLHPLNPHPTALLPTQKSSPPQKSHQLRISPPSRSHCAAARPLRAAAKRQMTAARTPKYAPFHPIHPTPKTPPYAPVPQKKSTNHSPKNTYITNSATPVRPNPPTSTPRKMHPHFFYTHFYHKSPPNDPSPPITLSPCHPFTLSPHPRPIPRKTIAFPAQLTTLNLPLCPPIRKGLARNPSAARQGAVLSEVLRTSLSLRTAAEDVRGSL